MFSLSNYTLYFIYALHFCFPKNVYFVSEVVTKVSALNLFIFELVLEYFSNGIEFQIVAVVYFSLSFFSSSVNGFNWSLAIFKLINVTQCHAYSIRLLARSMPLLTALHEAHFSARGMISVESRRFSGGLALVILNTLKTSRWLALLRDSNFSAGKRSLTIG